MSGRKSFSMYLNTQIDAECGWPAGLFSTEAQVLKTVHWRVPPAGGTRIPEKLGHTERNMDGSYWNPRAGMRLAASLARPGTPTRTPSLWCKSAGPPSGAKAQARGRRRHKGRGGFESATWTFTKHVWSSITSSSPTFSSSS